MKMFYKMKSGGSYREYYQWFSAEQCLFCQARTCSIGRGMEGGRGISHFSHFQQTFFLFMNRKLNFWELPLPPLLFGSMKEIEVKYGH